MTRAWATIESSVQAHWRLKVALSAGLLLLFWIPYLTLQRLPLFPARTLPLSAVDRAVPFDPGWIWMYQSIYVLVVAVPWLATGRSELIQYARGFLRLAAVSFAFFLVMPVQLPRPAATNAMLALVRWYDRPLNCFPSLHVGIAAYTVLFGARIADGRLSPGPRRWAIAAGWAWTALIAYSAMATKQHYAIDLPAGALLAAACHWWTWRNLQRSMAYEERPTVRARLSRDPVGVLLGDHDGYAAADGDASGRG